MYKHDLEQTLLGIDEEAELEIGPRDDRPSVVLVGGSAFMLNDVTNRSVTHDIDVFEADRCLREIIARYPEVNGMAVAYCDQMPFNYEDRLIPLDIGARFIRYFTPSLEDLAVMKLYAYRPNDIVDLHSQAFVDRLDWGLLERLIFDEGGTGVVAFGAELSRDGLRIQAIQKGGARLNLTFEGFLKGYCRELSGQQSLSFRKLVEQATTVAPRVAEPLFLLALAQGKAEYVLGLSEGSWMEEDYRDVLSLYGQAGNIISLCAKSELPNRYANVWRAYRAVKEKPVANRRINALMRKRILEALEESGVTRYGLCRALHLNKGNVYAYLAGDDSKVSRETARRIMEYAEERGTQEGAGRPVRVAG